MEIRKYIFLEIDGLYSALLPKKSLHSQAQDEYHAPAQNRSGYQKVFPNSINLYQPLQNSDQSTYYNIDGFMNIVIGKNNFSIHVAKEYIIRSFL